MVEVLVVAPAHDHIFDAASLLVDAQLGLGSQTVAVVEEAGYEGEIYTEELSSSSKTAS